MIKYWNRLIEMDNNRLTRYMFQYNWQRNKNNWCQEVYCLLSKNNLQSVFHDQTICNIDMFCERSDCEMKSQWLINLADKPKLRTYRTFKETFGTEKYIETYMPRARRSLYAQFRCGILPLNIETGRYTNTRPEERVCKICCSGEVEDELHFVLVCKAYREDRTLLFEKLTLETPALTVMPLLEKFHFLLTKGSFYLPKFISNIWGKRQELLFKTNI